MTPKALAEALETLMDHVIALHHARQHRSE